MHDAEPKLFALNNSLPCAKSSHVSTVRKSRSATKDKTSLSSEILIFWIRVQGSEFRVQGSGFRVWGLGFGVWGFGFQH